METRSGMIGRIGERVLSWAAFGLLVLLGIAIYRMNPETKSAIWGGAWRTVVWLILAAALPWVSRLFVRRLLAVGSNWAGAALIGALTVVDLVAGLLLMGGLPQGGWGWLAALAALGVAGSYNYLVAEYVAEQAGG